MLVGCVFHSLVGRHLQVHLKVLVWWSPTPIQNPYTKWWHTLSWSNCAGYCSSFDKHHEVAAPSRKSMLTATNHVRSSCIVQVTSFSPIIVMYWIPEFVLSLRFNTRETVDHPVATLDSGIGIFATLELSRKRVSVCRYVLHSAKKKYFCHGFKLVEPWIIEGMY